MNNRTDIRDLRTAIEVLKKQDGQYVETDVEVDPAAELSGVYRYVGAGGTVKRPTTIDGPAMMFSNIRGFNDARVIIGVLASRKRVGTLFGCEPEKLGWLLHDCVDHAVAPVVINGPALCQEVVHLATDPDFDLNKLVPAPTNTPTDAGPYITLGMCYATHPDTGEDPSSSPEYSDSISDVGISCKTIYDCTIPFHLKDRFKRAAFLEVDPRLWLEKW